MKNKIVFWSNHLKVSFSSLMPAELAKTAGLMEASDFDDLCEKLDNDPEITTVLMSLRPNDLEALYQVSLLQKSYGHLAFIAIFDTKDDVSMLTRHLNQLLSQANFPASSTDPRVNRHAVRVKRSESSAEERAKIHLTPRQLDVLELITQGKSNKEIARAFNLSEGTVKIHCMAIFKELGVTNRTQAAMKAEQLLFNQESPFLDQAGNF